MPSFVRAAMWRKGATTHANRYVDISGVGWKRNQRFESDAAETTAAGSSASADSGPVASGSVASAAAASGSATSGMLEIAWSPGPTFTLTEKTAFLCGSSKQGKARRAFVSDIIVVAM